MQWATLSDAAKNLSKMPMVTTVEVMEGATTATEATTTMARRASGKTPRFRPKETGLKTTPSQATVGKIAAGWNSP